MKFMSSSDSRRGGTGRQALSAWLIAGRPQTRGARGGWRTSNVVESPFAAVRLRTEAAKKYKRVENATAVIWRTLLIAEKRFRRLDHPELLAEVAEGATYVDGVRVKRTDGEAAA